MGEKPILFSAPMIRAILAGRKTQTRRVLKPLPAAGLRESALVPSGLEDGHGREIKWKFDVGDVLWVREAHYLTDDGEAECVVYAEDEAAVAEHKATIARLPPYFSEKLKAEHLKLRPSIHMPRWASRISLKVTGVKVERLQDISEEDAIAEGVSSAPGGMWSAVEGQAGTSARAAYAILWTSINGPGSWDANPWVVAITFERIGRAPE